MEKLNPPEDSIGDIPLFAVLYKDNIHLYRDMAGRSLHRRGYRSAMHVASLNESAAAGLLGLASWPKENAGSNPRIVIKLVFPSKTQYAVD